MCSSERPYEWPVCVQGGGASVKTALLFKTISLRRCKPLSLNRIMGLIERMQEYKSTLSDFIRDYSIPDEKWNDLIDLLGLYSEKLGKGEDIAGRDIEEALREILGVRVGSGTSFDMMKSFLLAAYNENVYPEVAERIKESELPNLF